MGRRDFRDPYYPHLLAESIWNHRATEELVAKAFLIVVLAVESSNSRG